MAARERDRDPELIDALAVGYPQRTAAKLAGVSDTTVTRRMRNPAFRARVEQARAERRARLLAMLDNAAETAVATLVREARGTGPTAVAAARAILSERFKAVESVEVRGLIEALEDRDLEVAS